MKGLFEFLNEAPLAERMVDRHADGDLIVSTVSVTDSDQPFETAIQHPNYNSGKWVIVEMHETREAAEQGHRLWVKIMTNKKLPTELVNVSTSGIKKFLDSLVS